MQKQIRNNKRMVMEKKQPRTELGMLIQILWYSKYHCGYLVKAVCSLAVMAFCVSVVQCTAPEHAGFVPQAPAHLAGTPGPQTLKCVNMQTDRHVGKSGQQR